VTAVLAIDVGGTFTDLVLLREDGSIVVGKTPTTADATDGLITGARTVAADAGIALEDIHVLRYGMTAAVNALLTRRGARVGLVVTQGMHQILHLARSQTPGPLVGWLNMEKPEPLADLALTAEVPERLLADGAVREPLDEAAARRALAALRDRGAEAIAVALLHSYANPVHEQRIRALAAEECPGLPVTLSSEILPEYREYERAVTTVANAFVTPAVERAVSTLEDRLAVEGWSPAVAVVGSDGALMTVKAALERPVGTIFSGPSGGIAGALAVARQAGIADILTLDMGGTSTDVAVCIGGEAQIARETIVGDFPIRAASLDLRSIGAGGGSIAAVPAGMRGLRVGPASAGSLPGPACYGRGGELPTVTDANLVLGRLTPALLGGDMALDEDAARAAVESLGTELGLDLEAVAQGVIDIVDETMAGALRVMTVERGLDPRDFALVAFGGAGPLHANALAVLLGCYPVVIPERPGVLSAFGFQETGHRASFSRTMIRAVDADALTEVRAAFNDLEARAGAWFAEEGVGDPQHRHSCDLRFLRQGYELEVPFTRAELDGDWAAIVGERFEAEHRRRYGFAPEAAIEIVSARLQSEVPTRVPEPVARPVRDGDGAQALVREARIWNGADWATSRVYARDRLEPGDRLRGPAIVEQTDTTTLVLPGHEAVVDAYGNILIGAPS
jgi:N-methylhydantoinase A